MRFILFISSFSALVQGTVDKDVVLREKQAVRVVDNIRTLHLAIPLPVWMTSSVSTWKETLCQGRHVDRRLHESALEHHVKSAVPASRVDEEMERLQSDMNSLVTEQYASMANLFTSTLLSDGKIPVALLDKHFLEMMTKSLGARQLEITVDELRRMLIHARVQIEGCFEDAIKLSMIYPSLQFTGTLYEMKDIGRFSNNGTIFQHQVVRNWVIKRDFENGTAEYFGVRRSDCSFLFGDVQCKNLDRKCIPTDLSACETAFFNTTSKPFTLIRPFGDDYLVATKSRIYMNRTGRTVQQTKIPSRVFTLSLARGTNITIEGQHIYGDRDETAFLFDRLEAVEEAADSARVLHLSALVDAYRNLDYDHESDRPLAFHFARWLVRLTAWVVVAIPIVAIGVLAACRRKKTERVQTSTKECASAPVEPPSNRMSIPTLEWQGARDPAQQPVAPLISNLERS